MLIGQAILWEPRAVRVLNLEEGLFVTDVPLWLVLVQGYLAHKKHPHSRTLQ